MPLYQLQTRKPDIEEPESCFIAPDASVIGHVSIKRDVSIWFGAVLRGDNEPITISAGSNIQENVVMHTDPGFPLMIGKGCTIGHKAMLHGCAIGDNTLIGMGATILNGATIGQNCLVGAHTLVPEGKTYPDNTLIIGTPGKVARTLSEENIKALKASAQTYIDKISIYRDGLKQIK